MGTHSKKRLLISLDEEMIGILNQLTTQYSSRTKLIEGILHRYLTENANSLINESQSSNRKLADKLRRLK